MLSLEMADAIVRGGARGEVGLTVLYDERCPLCRRLMQWLAGQRTLCPVAVVAADSADAHARFPALDHARSTRVLTVVTSDGSVYEDERAWLICGWALPGWRPLTERFGSDLRLKFVRVVTRFVDGYRHRCLRGPAHCERWHHGAPQPQSHRP